MRILALDAATEACSVAVCAGGTLVSRNHRLGTGAAESILSLVEAVLGESGTALRSLDAVAFGRGPGGFTGVRLAASVAQGLAFGAGLPVIPISDLRALAQQVFDSERDIEGVLVCGDARMREVYSAYCTRDARGFAATVGAERVGPPATVELPPQARGRIRGAGQGFSAYPELGERLGPRLTAGIAAELLPRAQEIARLAVPELEAGRTLPPEKALPVYLRDDVVAPPSQD